MNQRTLKKPYTFEGKGLHQGQFARMTLLPAAPDSGIRFFRTDLGIEIPALAEYVSSTVRCTTIASGAASVSTIEHLVSAMTGMGVDNVRVEIDNLEVPILDGSARPYVEAILPDGLQEQDAPRRYVEVREEIEIRNEHGSFVRISPADDFSYELTSDFGSRVLGVQTASWDARTDYTAELAPCRTFCFFHELEYLAGHGLIKGGDVDNAIVVVEHPVSDAQISSLAHIFGIQDIQVKENGYLNNLELHFPNECGRHKLLDLIGDLRLCGGFLRARVVAYKAGHAINTSAARALRESIR